MCEKQWQKKVEEIDFENNQSTTSKNKKKPQLHEKTLAKEDVERGREYPTKCGKIVASKVFQDQIMFFENYYEKFYKTQETLRCFVLLIKRLTCNKNEQYFCQLFL